MVQKLKNRLPEAGSLGQRALQAGAWNLSQVMLGHVLRLGSNLIMTRLLMPDAFALLSFVFLLITAFTLMTDVGIRNSILQEKDGEDPAFLRTAWVWKILRGALVAVFILLCVGILATTAPLWAPQGTIYLDARLPTLLALAAAVPLIEGFQSTQRELAERKITLGRITAIDLSAQVVSIVTMIAFAQISATAWALLIGSMSASIVKVVCSHICLPGPRMAFEWHASIGWRLWHFGKWLIGSSLMTFAAKSSDKLILGWLLNIITYGLFTIAVIWMTAATMVIQRLVNQVAYPLINEIKNNRIEDQTRLMRKIQFVIDGLCLMGFLGMFLVGPWMVQTLYTEPYHIAGQMIAIMSLGILGMRFDLLNLFLLSQGDSFGMMLISLQRAILMIAGIPLTYHGFGLEAALLLIGLHSLISVPFVLIRLRPVLDTRAIQVSVSWIVIMLAAAVLVSWSVSFN